MIAGVPCLGGNAAGVTLISQETAALIDRVCMRSERGLPVDPKDFERVNYAIAAATPLKLPPAAAISRRGWR